MTSVDASGVRIRPSVQALGADAEDANANKLRGARVVAGWFSVSCMGILE